MQLQREGVSWMLKLEALRLQKGLTQAELGKQAGVSPAVISQIENGRVVPYDVHLFRLAEALGARVQELLDEVELRFVSAAKRVRRRKRGLR